MTQSCILYLFLKGFIVLYLFPRSRILTNSLYRGLCFFFLFLFPLKWVTGSAVLFLLPHLTYVWKLCSVPLDKLTISKVLCIIFNLKLKWFLSRLHFVVYLWNPALMEIMLWGIYLLITVCFCWSAVSVVARCHCLPWNNDSQGYFTYVHAKYVDFWGTFGFGQMGTFHLVPLEQSKCTQWEPMCVIDRVAD